MKKREYSRNVKILLAVILFAILFTNQYGASFSDIKEKKTVSRMWYNCIEYTKSGELYEGHAECARGPIFFYILTGFSILFGEPSETPFQFSITIFLFMLQATLYIIFLKILRKMKKDWFFPTIFFLLFIFNTYTYSIETYSALIFLALAYYMLCFSTWKHRFYLIGVLSAIAFFLNITTLLVFFIVLFGRFVLDEKKIRFEKGSLSLSSDLLPSAGKFILGFLAVLGFFLAVHPNVLIYHLFVHINLTTTTTYAQSIQAMLLNFKVRYYLIYVLIALLLYFFWKTRKGIYFVSSASILLNTMQMTKTGFLFTRTMLTGTHYILASLFFVVLALSEMLDEKIFEKKKPWFIAALLVIMIFPGYVSSPIQGTIDEFLFHHDAISEDANSIRISVESVIGEVISKTQVKTVFYETGDRKETAGYLAERGAKTDTFILDSIDNKNLGEGDLYDPTLLEPFKKLLGEQYNEWRVNHPVNLSKSDLREYVEKARAGYYDMIIEGPPSWSATIEMMKDERVQNATKSYCQLAIPDMTYFEKEGMHHKVLLIKDAEKCDDARKAILDYYQKEYSSLCSKDQDVINERVGPVLAKNGIQVPRCTSERQVIARMVYDTATVNYKSLVVNKKEEAIYLLSIAGIFAAAYVYERKKRWI